MFLKFFYGFHFICISALVTNASKCHVSVSGIALVDHVMESFPIEDIDACYQRCHIKPGCLSINFYRSNSFCELNNGTVGYSPNKKVQNRDAVYFENPNPAITWVQPCSHISAQGAVDVTYSGRIFQAYCDSQGWTLIARFSNNDGKNWMRDDAYWWYNITSPQGNITSPAVNQDMISPAFWLTRGRNIKITRSDDPQHTALLQTTSNCLSKQTFRSFISSYGIFTEDKEWANKQCRGNCHVSYGGKYSSTKGFFQSQCSGKIQSSNYIGFWCDGDGDGAVMMIGGGGGGCKRADHGIAITEENEAAFKDSSNKGECDFGDEADIALACPSGYALNLWIK